MPVTFKLPPFNVNDAVVNWLFALKIPLLITALVVAVNAAFALKVPVANVKLSVVKPFVLPVDNTPPLTEVEPETDVVPFAANVPSVTLKELA